MARRRVANEAGFKDYYLILQVHPVADAGMIDAAYWHLARRYGEARLTDTSARAMMDDLNQAYSVLRSSQRREEYDKLRTLVLGAGTLPTPPPPAPEPVPLPVMERQRPRAREDGPPDTVVRGKFSGWGLARLRLPRLRLPRPKPPDTPRKPKLAPLPGRSASHAKALHKSTQQTGARWREGAPAADERGSDSTDTGAA